MENNIEIPAFIIRNLKDYGNCAIGRKTFKAVEHNKDKIIQSIKEKGLNVEFIRTESLLGSPYFSPSKRKAASTYVIKVIPRKTDALSAIEN